MKPVTPDSYAPTAGGYDLFNAVARTDQLAALEELFALLRPGDGPVLDLGAGSGLNTAMLLERLPEMEVLALEPSPAMRSLALAKVAARPAWFPRVTIRPEDFFAATLPDRLAGAILLGVLGHFDPGARAAVLAELAVRLAAGGPALIDLPAPERPAAVPAFEYTAATVGALSYRCLAEAWPLGGERMRWRMSYLTLEGDRVLVEDTTEHTYHHPDPAAVQAEADAVGLELSRLGQSTYWLLTRT